MSFQEPGWEWAAREYREAISAELGPEAPSLAVYVGQIRKPERIDTERCIAFFLTDEILRSIGTSEVGRSIIGDTRKAEALSCLLRAVEAWEDSHAKTLVESQQPVLAWDLSTDPVGSRYVVELAATLGNGAEGDSQIIDAIRSLFDGTLFDDAPNLCEASPSDIANQLRECVRAVERLWQPWPKLVGSLVQGDEVDLVVWINVDVADDKIEAVKRVVAATSAKRRDAILGTIQETARRLTRDKRHLMALLEDEFLTWNPGELEHRLKTFFYSHLYTASATGAKNQEAAIPGYETKPILSLRVERESRRFLNFYRSAVREGYLHDEDFLDSIRDAVRAAEERVWGDDSLATTPYPDPVIGLSGDLRGIAEFVKKYTSSTTDAIVLLTGEPGTGKGCIARYIHRLSARRKKPFVTVNCGSHGPELLCSELFGHEKGAFTGADMHRLGAFESAEDGTVFIDEIGVLPPDVQTRFLEAFQERQFQRMGSSLKLHIRAQIIVATNEDLASKVTEGQFRRDLYHRISGYEIAVLPLRQRPNDLNHLVTYFVELYSKVEGCAVPRVASDVWQYLQAHSWPGNVRELRGVISRALMNHESGVLRASDLNIVTAFNDDQTYEVNNGVLNSSPTALESVERTATVPALPITRNDSDPATWVPLNDLVDYYVWSALRSSYGNQSKAAKLLGITREQIRARVKALQKLGLDLKSVGKPPWPESAQVEAKIRQLEALLVDRGAPPVPTNMVDREIVEELVKERSFHANVLHGVARRELQRTRHYHQVISRLRALNGTADETPTTLPLTFCDVPATSFEGKSRLKSTNGVPVVVAPFGISKYPITVALYAQFIESTGHPHPESWYSGTPQIEKLRHPITEITWSDVQAFCEWISRVLGRVFGVPTDLQWLAASGVAVDGRKYPWGSAWLDGACNSAEVQSGGTTPVDAFESRNVSPYGCVDMLGNVWEWTSELAPDLDREGFPWRVARGGASYTPLQDLGLKASARCSPGHFLPVTDLGLRIVELTADPHQPPEHNG